MSPQSFSRRQWTRALALGGLSFAIGNGRSASAAPLFADDKPTTSPHTDLSYYLDAAGAKQPIRSVADWEKRREQILANLRLVMGDVPKDVLANPPRLEMQVENEVVLDGGLRRRKISYHTDSTERRVKAFLFLPASRTDQRRAALLCLQQTIQIGKEEPAGLGGNPHLHYALQLAQRGYVTLAPDYPSFGEYTYTFPAEHGYVSGSMKAIFDNRRAIDLLQSLPEVDGERIGCIGHSLGGHNTLFTAVFEPRIKVAVTSCGFTRFHKYYGGALQGWTSARYMPRIKTVYHNDPNQVPFDFPEILAAIAPRAIFTNSPTRDDNFEVSGVRDSIAMAEPIFKLLGAEAKLRAVYPECAHDFPDEAREQAYQFIDAQLKEVAK